jgi:hypothetical protein
MLRAGLPESETPGAGAEREHIVDVCWLSSRQTAQDTARKMAAARGYLFKGFEGTRWPMQTTSQPFGRN